MNNTIWVVKVRMFTTKAGEPTAYRSLWRAHPPFHSPTVVVVAHPPARSCSSTDGLTSIYKTEGLPGLYRGTTLALFGVSNGAIQFMAYEEMKRWGFERKKRQFARAGREYTTDDDKLVRPRAPSPCLVPPLTSCPAPRYAVQHGIHSHVRGEQAVRARVHVPVSSRPLPDTGAPRPDSHLTSALTPSAAL